MDAWEPKWVKCHYILYGVNSHGLEGLHIVKKISVLGKNIILSFKIQLFKASMDKKLQSEIQKCENQLHFIKNN